MILIRRVWEAAGPPRRRGSAAPTPLRRRSSTSRRRAPRRPGAARAGAATPAGRARRPRRRARAAVASLASRGQLPLAEEARDLVGERALVVDELLGRGAGALEQRPVCAPVDEAQVGEARLAGSEELALAAELQILLGE